MKKCRFSETLPKTVLIFLECPKSFLDILNVGFQLLLVQRSLQFSGLAPCSILMNIEVYYIMNSAYTCFKSQTTLTKDIELLEGKYPENLLEGRISRHSGQGYSFCQNMNGNLNWRMQLHFRRIPYSCVQFFTLLSDIFQVRKLLLSYDYWVRYWYY